jgi:hypothetical protein
MKELVSRRFRTAASITPLVLVWALFVSPQGPWAGLMSLGALGILLLTTAVLWTGRSESTPAMATVICEGVNHRR